MKLAKRFFYRMDIVRNYCRGFLVLSIFSLFFSRMNSVAFLFFIGCIVLFSTMSFFKVPKKSDIAEFVSNAHADFEAQVKRPRTSVHERDFYTLYAYSTKRRRLARNIGNRMYFPEFYTLVFQKTEDGLIMHQGTVYLFENKKAEASEHHFYGEAAMQLECGEADLDLEYRQVTVKKGDTPILECYIRNDHTWRTFLELDRRTVLLIS